MKTAQDVVSFIRQSKELHGSLLELRDALVRSSVKPTSEEIGRMTARDVLATFELREETTRIARVETVGFPETLDRLRQLGRDEGVAVVGFNGPFATFMVFFREEDDSLIGCIRVTRRDGNNDGGGEP